MSTTPHSGSDREIQRELERAKSEASQLASDAAETAKRRGQQTIDRAKDKAADKAEEFASALESRADDLESSEAGEMLSGYGRSMAELMRRFAGGLRENEIEDFAGQLAGFARRNPASFLAGSVAIGFGVSRFLKATSTRTLEEYGYDDEEEYLLGEEDDDFDFDESGIGSSSRGDDAGSSSAYYGDSSSTGSSTGYGAGSSAGYGGASSSDYDRSSRSSSNYGSASSTDYSSRADNGSSSQSTYGSSSLGSDKSAAYGSPASSSGSASSDTWPQDRGRERPGAGSGTDHLSPAASDTSKRSAGSSARSETDITAPSGSTGAESSQRGRDESRKDDSRRNEP